MITTLPVAGNAVSGASRRRLYRHSKRVLTRLLGRRWSGPRWTLEPAVRRFLRTRPRSFLARLLGDRGFALAAVVSLAATGTAGAIPPIELSDVAAGTGGFVINGIDPSDYSGRSVSGAGDVNGTGRTGRREGYHRRQREPAVPQQAGQVASRPGAKEPPDRRLQCPPRPRPAAAQQPGQHALALAIQPPP